MAHDLLKIERCAVSSKRVLVQFGSEQALLDPASLFVEIVEFNGANPTRMDIEAVADRQTRCLVLTPIQQGPKGAAVGIQGEYVMVRIGSSAGQPIVFDKLLKVGDIWELPPDTASEARRTTNAVEDAVSYSLLTDNIGSGTPGVSPVARNGSPDGAGGAQLISQTLRDVLGWKVRDDDPKGFAGALTASFSIADIEGHTEWTYTPRTYAVQTDLNGGITGAQASLYKRAQEALAQALPLLDGLYPLLPDADVEDIAAVKAVLRKQLEELVGELGAPGGPGLTRVEHYFNLLLAGPGSTYDSNGQVRDPEPDDLQGMLGRLRDVLGLSFADDLVNSVEDEQNQTNYRILADYLTALAQSWLSNRKFFGLTSKSPFLGTQLVPISRQLSVIAESVDELRFTLDSVFIGAAERQTLELRFGTHGQPMYAEDFFRWIQNFVTTEAPSYVQDGGKFGIGNSVVPFASQLCDMTKALLNPNANQQLPPGFHSARVQRSIKSLAKELQELVRLANPLKRDFAIQPVPAQLSAAVNAKRLAALQGVLYFADGQKQTLSTTLLNLSDAPLYVTASCQQPADIKFFDSLASSYVDLAQLQPGNGVPVHITVAGPGFDAANVQFQGWFDQVNVGNYDADASAEVTLLKAGS